MGEDGTLGGQSPACTLGGGGGARQDTGDSPQRPRDEQEDGCVCGREDGPRAIALRQGSPPPAGHVGPICAFIHSFIHQIFNECLLHTGTTLRAGDTPLRKKTSNLCPVELTFGSPYDPFFARP